MVLWEGRNVHCYVLLLDVLFYLLFYLLETKARSRKTDDKVLALVAYSCWSIKHYTVLFPLKGDCFCFSSVHEYSRFCSFTLYINLYSRVQISNGDPRSELCVLSCVFFVIKFIYSLCLIYKPATFLLDLSVLALPIIAKRLPSHFSLTNRDQKLIFYNIQMNWQNFYLILWGGPSNHCKGNVCHMMGCSSTSSNQTQSNLYSRPPLYTLWELPLHYGQDFCS